MTQIATIEKVINADYAEIVVPRESACGHNCADCAGCGLMGSGTIHATARNPIHAKVGDKVVVEGSTRKVLGVAALVYVVPLICFFIGYAIGSAALHWSDGMSGLLGLVLLVAGLIPALLYNRYAKKTGTLQYEIVRLF